MEKIRVNLKKYPFVHNGIAFVSLAKRVARGVEVEAENVKSSWVPFMMYIGVKPVSVVKDGTICDKIDMVEYCKRLKPEELRLLTETLAALTPLISDALYQVDHAGVKKDVFTEEGRKSVFITNWQSYGRSYIVELDEEIKKFRTDKTRCAVLPCMGKRPYEHGEYPGMHRVVITSLGIIPEEYWNHPVVLNYNTGVPDIWRVFKLAKHYFSNNRYEYMECYLDFAPYIEIMNILEKILDLNIVYKTKPKYYEFGPKFAIE